MLVAHTISNDAHLVKPLLLEFTFGSCLAISYVPTGPYLNSSDWDSVYQK